MCSWPSSIHPSPRFGRFIAVEHRRRLRHHHHSTASRRRLAASVGPEPPTHQAPSPCLRGTHARDTFTAAPSHHRRRCAPMHPGRRHPCAPPAPLPQARAALRLVVFSSVCSVVSFSLTYNMSPHGILSFFLSPFQWQGDPTCHSPLLLLIIPKRIFLSGIWDFVLFRTDSKIVDSWS